MWHLYLDESGDLGFNFAHKSPSKHLTICVLAISQRETAKRIEKAVRRTLKRINGRRGTQNELKATRLSIEAKRYFYRLIADCRFGVYSVTLNKERVYEQLRKTPAIRERLYNFVAAKVLERIPFEAADDGVELIVDRSKGKWEIAEFNRYIENHLQGRLDPRVPLKIHHRDSCADRGLSAVDLFCWGIFRKHEQHDAEWYGTYQEKIRLDERYL